MKIKRPKTATHLFRYLLSLALLLSGLNLAPQMAHAEITLPPKGVSQELWKAYQEVVITNVGGADRNLRWNTNPYFYISGNPTAADNNIFQGTLSEIRKYCINIQPNITTTAPSEGVLLNYLPRSKFVTLIPDTPEKTTTSYASYLYYLNRGLTKFTAALSTDATQSDRDSDTQIRIYQGLGLLGYTQNINARMLSWGFSDSGVATASELDKQIIRLYCSTYSRSWDTSQQTFDLISSAWSKKINIPSLNLNIKVGEYKNQLNFAFNFDPSQALDNQLTGIEYAIYDSSGVLASSGKLDVSGNLFKSYEVVLKGIKDNSRYKMEAFPVNANGNGSTSKGEGRAGTQPAPVDYPQAAEASEEITDTKNAALAAIDAAKEALADYEKTQLVCTEISSEFKAELQELYQKTKLNSYCDKLEIEVALLDAKIGALDPDKASTVDDANSLTDEANVYAEDADSFVAQIQDMTDELEMTEKQFLAIQKVLVPLNDLENSVTKPWSLIVERLTLLPANLQSTIKKDVSFKLASKQAGQIAVVISARDAQLAALAAVNKPEQLLPIVKDISAIKTTNSQLSQFKKWIVSINKLIPAKVCQKGALTVLPNKSGKCAAGFGVVPTL